MGNKVAIFDACFPLKAQKNMGLAASWLNYICDKKNISVVNADKADVFFVTCVFPTQWKFVEALRKKYKTKRIIVGGAASTSPAVFSNYCDAVVVGEGKNFINSFAANGVEKALEGENIFYAGKKSVSVDNDFPWDTPPIMAEDKAYRVFCGRGCRKKCFFCQTGWAYKYSENPNPKLLFSQIKNLLSEGKKIGYLSNDIMQHSFFHKLPKTEHGSYSVQYLKKNGLPPARQIRLGVEGCSERLRAFVNKKISYDELLKATIWLNENKKSVRWFMIAGLPTEKAEDWNELKKIILEWKRYSKKGVLALSFTSWVPTPASVFAPFEVKDDYYENWLDFENWFFKGIGFSNRIKLMKPSSPKNRMFEAEASMCLDEKKLRTGGNYGPNDVVNYPYKKSAKKIYKKLTERSTNATTTEAA